ncbi:2-succinyl-5-enolpyruvyl-6-hydroxy-3-cyclohexene-1-carboxylic-acid synthase [uncultured Ellagibacter sp.]|uniref:2-succinyl-5-enolpyruvyl-6-hydroxy-3- cyclohexene-1-carboxylic-acid synthase n=1 Tax=uncultured Ellagibacter sp. TaxID=2137580 RepID=UPI0025CB8487|nr:2-succinyl-5-enolpyruvyl-6-hydroxy-3-cyclohexene-1-carboxylic-acid synthase [uncultured Ellagibacter sp.]
MAETSSVQQATALVVSAFFDELARWGVREVVVSPGSRSTALAMCAYELGRREPERMTVYVDIDERSASFFALGLAKASGRPVALVCTSGTALANYYPAVLEAETSRVPLIVLSGDRPPHLQGLGAPQTCDQVKAYSDHVRRFIQMPLAEDSPRAVAFARQAARELVLGALPEGCLPLEGDAVASRACSRMAGPVHANFLFDEPLKPDFSTPGVFSTGRSALDGAGGLAGTAGIAGPEAAAVSRLSAAACDQVKALIRGRRALVLAGEGTCESLEEAREMAAWAKAYGLPLLADPLSGLRSLGSEAIIDNYDNVFGRDDFPAPEVVIRFGRYPVSKRCVQKLAAARPIEIVVDAGETRDFNAMTDLFVACTPIDFARSLLACDCDVQASAGFFSAWREANAAERARILSVEEDLRQGATGDAADEAWVAGGADSGSAVTPRPEGAYVREILKAAPVRSCLFSANSMAIRAIDTFYVKGDKPLAVLCNRGLNGIDGTVSTALGVAQHFEQTTFLTGDFTLQHDLGGLALQREIAQVAAEHGKPAPSIVVVLLNNNGGGIFEMLPQASDEPYFARLFSAPQDVDFSHAAAAFNVPYRKVGTPSEFSQVYGEMLGTPGISLIEVKLPLSGLKARYRAYQ